MSFLGNLGDVLVGAMPYALLSCGMFFTVKLRAFPLFRAPRVLRDLFPRGGGRAAVSARRAMLTALGGTVGVGNIAGVALALTAGGAGSIFWMWICAAFAMILKYAEIVLAMDTRVRDKDGHIHGGMAYAMRAYALKKQKSGGTAGPPKTSCKNGRYIWLISANLFACCCLGYILLVGGAIQANAVADCIFYSFSLPPWTAGLVLVLVTLPVAFGRGGKRVVDICAKIVPFMCILYTLACLAVLCRHAGQVPAAFSAILREALTPQAAGGGCFGFLFSRAARIGAARGLMSNEGGCGTSPAVHITSEENIPAKQGIFGIFEVFIDTVVICSLTALSILSACPDLPAEGGGMGLARAAFSTVFGNFAGVLLSACLCLFAYATVLCNLFYGQECLSFFTENRAARGVFFLVFGASLFLGACAKVEAVWRVTDILLATMTFLNLAFLTAHHRRVVDLSDRYIK